MQSQCSIESSGASLKQVLIKFCLTGPLGLAILALYINSNANLWTPGMHFDSLTIKKKTEQDRSALFPLSHLHYLLNHQYLVNQSIPSCLKISGLKGSMEHKMGLYMADILVLILQPHFLPCKTCLHPLGSVCFIKSMIPNHVFYPFTSCPNLKTLLFLWTSNFQHN